MRKSLLGFLLLGMIAACSFAPKDIGHAYMFSLSSPRVAAQKTAEKTLIVSLPVAAPELDTFRIALNKNDGRWDYYAGARWSDFLPLLVQDSLTKTLEGAKAFQVVTTDQSGVPGDVILKTDLRSFQALYKNSGMPPTIQVKMAISLRKRQGDAVIGSFVVHTKAKAEKDSLPEIQAAFSRAFNDAQKQTVNRMLQFSFE